ncbi:MAG: hypothetical protein AAB347_06795 [Bacteroidota bacterium]
MKNLILGLILLTTLSGCLLPNDIWAKDESTLIFQSEYTNYAWGYNHNGWMLDISGQVKRFQKSAKWVFADSLGYISATDMQKNMSACDSVIEQIDSKEFTLYAEKAINCVNWNMTKPQNTMADAGEHIYAFYLYESGSNRYKRVILNMTGDWSQENLAPNAKEIVDWMKAIK